MVIKEGEHIYHSFIYNKVCYHYFMPRTHTHALSPPYDHRCIYLLSSIYALLMLATTIGFLNGMRFFSSQPLPQVQTPSQPLWKIEVGMRAESIIVYILFYFIFVCIYI